MFKIIKVFISIIIISILALLAIPFFIDVNDYKPEISKAVYDATGRNLEIENIQLSLFPWVGVTLKNVALENAQSFSNKNMVTIKTIDVQLELMPLLSKQIEVKRFLLDSPKIWLEQRADRVNNWQDLQGASQPAPASAPTVAPVNTVAKSAVKQPSKSSAKAPEEAPISLNADLLKLTNGQIIWSDSNSGEIILSDIQLTVKDLQLKQPISITMSAKLGNNPFNINANIGPIGDISKLDTTKLPVRIKFNTKDFSLAPLSAFSPTLEPAQMEQFGDLKQAKISLDLSVEQHTDSMIVSTGTLQAQLKDNFKASWKLNSKALKSLTIQDFQLSANDTHVLELSGNIKNLTKKPHFEFRVETAKLQRIWLNHFVPALQDIYKDHPEPWGSIKLGTLIAGDQDILDIRDLQIQLNDEHVQASGNIALGDAPDVQLRISADTLHLDPWIPQSKETTPTKASTAQGATPTAPQASPSAQTPATKAKDVEPDLTFLKPWYLSIQLSAKSIQAMKLDIANVRMTLSAEKGVVRLNPLKFDISGGKISENFTLYANKYPATWTESMNVRGVSVQPILKAVADFDKLSGITDLTTNLSGKGLLPKNITKSLNGNGNFAFKDGQFKGVDIANEVRKLKKQKATQTATNFALMKGSFRVKSGVLTNNDLYMASPLFRLTGKGKLYLDPLKVDYHVRPRLIDSLAGQGGNQGQRGIVIPLHISGPFDNLKVSVEFDKQSLLDSAAALNKATGSKIGGAAGKVLEQGFVKTRDEEIAKRKAEAKRKADAKIAAERARLEAAAKKKAEEKLKSMFKGFGF